MSETRKIAAILVSDVVGYSRLAGADEERTLARLRALRSDLIDPTIAVHHGRIVKRTGDGLIVEFRSVVDAVRCAIEMQDGMVERNAGVAPDKRIESRIGVHLGDVVEESDGDLMGDGVNIAARLEGICEPGGICLSDDAYRQARDRVKETFTDLGEKALKNIARPVRAYAVQPNSGGLAPAPFAPEREKSGAPRLSIVVLPFANTGGDPEQEYFADGVTDSLTTDLARGSFLLVIGRNTAFTYKGKAVDLKQIGRDLNVRYVLEGSVQRARDRMRVNVQLVDAETGNHLWAERFDKPLADLFDMQDEIIARVANALRTPIHATEASRAERAPNPDSMDYYFQGMAWFNKGMSPEYSRKARGYFERALALDPNNVRALVGMAFLDTLIAIYYYSDDRAARLIAAEAAATKALSLAPEYPDAHLLFGSVLMLTNRGDHAIAECERALTLNRNIAGAHAQIGIAKLFVGRGEETESHIHEALRLSPRDTDAFSWFAFVGFAKLYLGTDEAAVAWLRRSIDANRNYPVAHFALAAALAHRGRLDEARSAVRAGLALNPAFTISRFRAGTPSDNPTFLFQRERVYDGMRKAGVPEGEKSAN
jgi:TolB-like protein/class 3 adenylate cyclase/Tfp pilus assembly protein PilF